VLAWRLALGAARRGAPFGHGVGVGRFAGLEERFPESAQRARPERTGERSEPGTRKGGRSTPPPRLAVSAFHAARAD